MRLTNEHLRFWQARKATPKWAVKHDVVPKPPLGGSEPQVSPPRIHTLIAGHAGPGYTRELYGRAGVSNTIFILRSARKRGELRERLKGMALAPGTVVGPERRAAFCKRWYERVTGEKLVQIVDRATLREHILSHGYGEPTQEGYKVAWKLLQGGSGVSRAAREVVARGLTREEPGRAAEIEHEDDEPRLGMER